MSSSEIYSILQSTKLKRTSYVLLDNAVHYLALNVEKTSSSFASGVNSLYNGYTTDDGKTIADDRINDAKGVIDSSLSELNSISSSVSNMVASLDRKISSLQASYNAALAREREAALKNSKTGA